MSDSMIAGEESPFSVVEKKQRYPVPAAAAKQRRLLRPGPRVIFDEMIDRFRKDGREREVAVTVRQLAQACQMSEGSVKNAIKTLIEKGFIVVVSRGTIDIKRKPSTYRLTMFACHGKEATHDYADAKEWKRAGTRDRSTAPMPKTVRLSFELAPDQLPAAVEALTPFTLENA
jgi:ribosomal protein S25